MQKKLGIFLQCISQLTGISCIIDVLESSFKETLSPQLRDLHCLSENILKAKQVSFMLLLGRNNGYMF